MSKTTPFRLATIAWIFAVPASLALAPADVRIAAPAAVTVLYLASIIAGVFVIRLEFYLPIVNRIRTSNPVVALTFDDGPDRRCTPVVLDVLARTGAPAAFFVMGSKAVRHPELVQQIAEAGHEIGNHSHEHSLMHNFLFGRSLRSDLELCQEAVFKASGRTPRYYRPPVGLTNPHLGSALQRLGLTCVGWDVNPRDTRRSLDRVAADVLERARPGSVIVLHDRGRPPEEMEDLVTSVIEGLGGRGFRLVGLDELIAAGRTRPREAVQ